MEKQKRWDYRYFGDDGKIYFYYGVGDIWGYIDPDSKEKKTLKILSCYLADGKNGKVQYYKVAINNIGRNKPETAARLHFLFSNEGKRLVEGQRMELPDPTNTQMTNLANIDFLISIARGVNPITGIKFKENDLLRNVKVSKRIYDLAYELKDDLLKKS